MKAGLDEPGARMLWAKIVADVVMIEDADMRERARLALHAASEFASQSRHPLFSTEWYCSALMGFRLADDDVRNWFYDTLMCRFALAMCDEN